MIGIVSYGAYIPMWRMDREEIARAAGTLSAKGERAVASWDEDSLSMAVEAGLDCLTGIDPNEVDALYFATVSSPLKEKQASSIIATALDLKENVHTCDVTDSTRAATSAIQAAFDSIKAGSAKKVLVVASDSRPVMMGSEFEQIGGDGAAALLIGKGEAAADIEGFYTVSDAIPGPWRRETDTFPRMFAAKLDRKYGLLKDVPEAVSGLLKECELEVKDVAKFALYAPDPRGYFDLARELGIEAMTQVENPLFEAVGITGTPHCLLLLVAALEKAEPDQRIVCASYGEGSDALLIRTTKMVEDIRGKRRGTGFIASKRMLPSYGRFYDFKKAMEAGDARPDGGSVVKYWRDEKWGIRLYGMRCNNCGTLQYPISRCCMICGEKDNHQDVKLARKGKVFAYTHDYLLGPGSIPGDGTNPCTRVIVDLEDGCRMWMEMSDNEIAEVKIDMPVELTFRLFRKTGGFPYYGWRARPVR
jgi:3-hydroxy-3-methylglutaryl CoA synthase